MALTNTLKRVASRVVPFASRAFQAAPPRYAHRGSALFSAVNRRFDLSNSVFKSSLPSAFHHFSTRPASDESLLKIIQDEIQYAVDADENINKVAELPSNFPFKLEDNPGLQTVTLTREYQGETIVVEVQMPSTVTGSYEENDDDDGDADDEKATQSQLPLVVRVSKSRGPCLEFGCTAYPDEITVDSLTVKDPDGSDDQIAYEGPEFTDLDENLQKVFHKYLEIRGVKPSTTNFLHEYMINKDSKEYVMWLKNLKKFVEA